MTHPLLIVEDESDIQELLQLHLKREGYEVVIAADGHAAWKLLQQREFRMALIDWMLPGGVSGIELTRLIRSNTRLAPMGILMLTARASDTDIISGLEAGADDYVTKPFETPVLMARVRALLRRQPRATAAATTDEIRLGDLILSSATHEVRFQTKRLDLTPYEFKLLLCLMKNAGRVLTRDRLIDEVQGAGVAVVDRAVDTQVFGLRKKLGDAAAYIETVRGVGYRIALPGKDDPQT